MTDPEPAPDETAGGEPSQTTDDLRRVIGFWSGVAILIGCTIGSGIFRTPASIAAKLDQPLLILGLWTGLGIITLCGALTLAELACLIPKTGGIYAYLRAAYGDATAFVFGWLWLLISTPASLGAMSTFFAEQLLVRFRPDGANPVLFRWGSWSGGELTEVQAVAMAVTVVLSLFNVFGVRLGTAIQNIFTSIKVGALLAIIAAAFLLGSGDPGRWVHGTGRVMALSPVAGLAAAMASVVWTYDGWIGASLVAGEIKDPQRKLSGIMIVGTLALVVLYVGANLAYLYLIPLNLLQEDKAKVATRVMDMTVGPAGGTIVGYCIMASVFGALNGSILSNARVTYAQARDGLAFAFLGRCHPRWKTPHVAILIQGAAGVVLIQFLKDFDSLTTYFVVVAWGSLIFAMAAIFVLRRKMPDAPRPYRTPFYPWVPLVFIAGTTIGLSAIVWNDALSLDPPNYSPLVGIGIALAGFPVYWLWRQFRADRET